MLDILQLRVRLDTFDRLRLCQTSLRSDCHAAFTVKGFDAIWPMASWGEIPPTDRINVRSWFPVLDQIADELLIWQPEGGCFFVFRDSVSYRVAESDVHGVLFMQIELDRLTAVPARSFKMRRAHSMP